MRLCGAVAGGSLAGYKMNRRVAGLSEFQFVKQGQVVDSLEVVISVSGWLDAESDYDVVWSPLQRHAPLAELYTLRWETEHLLALGRALQSISVIAVAKGWVIGKIKALLIGSLLAAVAWPLWLVNASKLIDNAYSVIMVHRTATRAHCAQRTRSGLPPEP